MCVLSACVCINEQEHKLTYSLQNGSSGKENTNCTNNIVQCFPRNSEQVDQGELFRKENLESQG